MSPEKVKQLIEQCYEMKLKALDMALSTGVNGSHIGGAFSSMEIFAALYEIANVENPVEENRDRIIVSKGHCVLSYYTALWKKGLITEDELDTFDKNGTNFHGHPHRELEKGMEYSSGSLGLGMSYAVGVALACKRKQLSNQVFVIVGDGECDEGIVWEALMSIANYKLNNITVIVDRNGYQVDGATDDVMNLFSLDQKFKSFGFETMSIDGHDLSQLIDALRLKSTSPKIIVANTRKANGISFLEGNKVSHHTVLSKKRHAQAIEEIRLAYGKL